MRVLPYGPRAVLVEFDALSDVVAHSSAWRAAAMPGVVDVVPAARTVLVTHDGTFDTAQLNSIAVGDAPAPTGAIVTIDTAYDGDDLPTVARQCGMTVDEVVSLHSGVDYTVAFCGFMPGFGYLIGLPAALHLPRRSTPRTRVPAGAVAIAAEFAGVYPRESPGGWHLLGHTAAELWSEVRDPPALLTPGTRVRFRPR